MGKKDKEKQAPEADQTQVAEQTIGDAIIEAAVKFVQARRYASQVATQHNMGPGGVNEAMKEVGKADRALTEAVDLLSPTPVDPEAEGVVD